MQQQVFVVREHVSVDPTWFLSDLPGLSFSARVSACDRPENPEDNGPTIPRR